MKYHPCGFVLIRKLAPWWLVCWRLSHRLGMSGVKQFLEMHPSFTQRACARNVLRSYVKSGEVSFGLYTLAPGETIADIEAAEIARG